MRPTQKWPTLAFVSMVLTSGLAGLLSMQPADAAQLFIQQSGTSPAGGDPNIITNTSAFVLGLAGNHTAQNPVLVGLAVYDGQGTPHISFSGCATPSACPAATVGTYGLGTNSTTFTAGTAGGDVFDALGLPQGGGSISFGNFSTADVANGFAAPTSFTLDVFAVPITLTGTTTIDESGAANGSFLFAFSCEDGTGTSIGCVNPANGHLDNGQVDQTVFGNVALINTRVPEPASLALFGTALLALGFLARRRKRK